MSHYKHISYQYAYLTSFTAVLVLHKSLERFGSFIQNAWEPIAGFHTPISTEEIQRGKREAGIRH
jgi:hypothetical protein